MLCGRCVVPQPKFAFASEPLEPPICRSPSPLHDSQVHRYLTHTLRPRMSRPAQTHTRAGMLPLLLRSRQRRMIPFEWQAALAEIWHEES